MKITLSPTPQLLTLCEASGSQGRLWTGTAENGARIEALVAWVCVDEADGVKAREASLQLEAELCAIAPPEGAEPAILTLRATS